MNIINLFLSINILLLTLSLTSCRRSGDEVWEDSKSCSRHVGRGFKTLGGKHGDSRQINDPNEFYASDDPQRPGPNSDECEFIALQDENGNQFSSMSDSNYRQPRETPGDPGSSIPGIDSFQDPSTNPALARIFQNIFFEYNSSLVKGQENLQIIRDIAEYMRRNGNTYIFVEGHTDERGAEAYNLALGSHRSNAVRNLLVNEGVNPDNVFTISYGKERPAVLDHHEEAWNMNRRAEFKVYQR